jgi:hypothetical protein
VVSRECDYYLVGFFCNIAREFALAATFFMGGGSGTDLPLFCAVRSAGLGWTDGEKNAGTSSWNRRSLMQSFDSRMETLFAERNPLIGSNDKDLLKCQFYSESYCCSYNNYCSQWLGLFTYHYFTQIFPSHAVQ